MPGFSVIIRYIIMALAGYGGMEAFDRFFGKKQGIELSPAPGFKPFKTAAIAVGCIAGGGLVWRFINSKFHILTARHARRRKTRRRSRAKRRR